MTSGWMNFSLISFRYLGCARLNGEFFSLKEWTLCKIPSLFLIFTVVPAGIASTWGTYSHFTWSITASLGTLTVCFKSAIWITAFLTSPRLPTTRTGSSLKSPQTSLSLPMVTFPGAWVPLNTTLPVIVPTPCPGVELFGVGVADALGDAAAPAGGSAGFAGARLSSFEQPADNTMRTASSFLTQRDVVIASPPAVDYKTLMSAQA